MKTLLVTEDSPVDDRRKATELGSAQRGSSPYKAVVSVLMLREGWDVPEVGVILLLRKFGSRVYGQQVIGRGLRRVRNGGGLEDEPQICVVVDHPKLEHKWLWDIFSSKVRANVGIDDEYNEEEDLPEPPPRQVLVKPENIIDIPDPSEDDHGEFVLPKTAGPPEPLKNWREVLEGIAYPAETVTITNQEIGSIESTELTSRGWSVREAAAEYLADGNVDVDREDLEAAIKQELLDMSDKLLEYAGFSMQFKGQIYGILLGHMRTKFLDGTSLGLAERHHLDAAWRVLPQVEERIKTTAGLVEGMVKYGNK